MYVSTLEEAIPGDQDIYGYADDHALRSVFTPGIPGMEELSLLSMSQTMDEVTTWM